MSRGQRRARGTTRTTAHDVSVPLMADGGIGLPKGGKDERELLRQWLGYLRRAALRKIDGLDDSQAHWTPDGKLIPLVGIVTTSPVSSGGGSTAASVVPR